MLIDVAANRRARKWSRREQAGRALWVIARPLFRLSPRPLWAWRNFVLRLFGAEIGPRVHICPTVDIAIPWNLSIDTDTAIGEGAILYNLGLITVGAAATISQRAHLCAGTHDHHRPDMQLVKRPIRIGEGAWVCTEAFIGPGVTVGDYAVVAARAVAVRDVESWVTVAGNPAKVIGKRPRPMA